MKMFARPAAHLGEAFSTSPAKRALPSTSTPLITTSPLPLLRACLCLLVFLLSYGPMYEIVTITNGAITNIAYAPTAHKPVAVPAPSAFTLHNVAIENGFCTIDGNTTYDIIPHTVQTLPVVEALTSNDSERNATVPIVPTACTTTKASLEYTTEEASIRTTSKSATPYADNYTGSTPVIHDRASYTHSDCAGLPTIAVYFYGFGGRFFMSFTMCFLRLCSDHCSSSCFYSHLRLQLLDLRLLRPLVRLGETGGVTGLPVSRCLLNLVVLAVEQGFVEAIFKSKGQSRRCRKRSTDALVLNVMIRL